MRLLSNISPFRPIRYDLRLIILSLKYPKYLLLQTIHFEKNPLLEQQQQQDQSQDKMFLRLHANSKNLEIMSVFGGKVFEKSPIDNTQVTPENHDVMTIQIDDNNDTQKLHLLIDAKLNLDEMKGMYRSKYKNSKTGEDCVLWSTHFEPIAARDCFACVDEPSSRCDYTTSYIIANTKENADIIGLNNAPLVETLNKVAVDSFFTKEESFSPSTSVSTNEKISQLINQWIDENSSQQQQQIEKSNFRKLSFALQPKTSSYLIAMAIGELEYITHPSKYISPLSKREIPIRFYYAKGRDANLARFALDVYRHAIEFFEKYFEVPYPLPKLDVFAPPDFAIGGEENFGLIFVTERVLIDPAKTSTARKISLTDLNEHESSHLWFGDLVSIASWEGLWLKEGFASFFGVYAAHHKDPSWGALAGLAEHMYGALEVDSHVATHQVEVPIHDTSLITQIFDSISYNKGLSIVNMLYHFLGAEGFRKAISAYITKYQWQSTTTAQLWASLEETSGKPVSKIMNSFTSLEGYPIVSASLIQQRNSSKIKLTQSRYSFAAPASAVAAAAESPLWTIPVIVQSLVGRDTKSVTVNFGDKDIMVEMPSADSNAVIMVNENHNGYYRVEYDAPLFKRILLNYQFLPEAFRTGLIDDTVALVSAGRSPANLLQLLDKVRQFETSAVVLLHAISIVPPVFKKFASEIKNVNKKIALFEKCYGVFIDQAERLGPKTIPKENSQLSQLRPLCFGVVLKAYDLILRDEEFASATSKNATLQKTTKLATSFHESADKLAKEIISAPNNAKDVVFDSELLIVQLRYAVRFGTEENANNNFDGLWKVYCNDPDALICRDIVLGLTSTASSSRFEMLVDETYGTSAEEKIRSQMGHIMTANFVSNPTLGKAVLWNGFKKNIESIDKKWGSGQFRIQMICENIAFAATQETNPSEAYAIFFEEHPLVNAAMSIKRSIQQLQVSDELKTRASEVEQWI